MDDIIIYNCGCGGSYISFNLHCWTVRHKKYIKFMFSPYEGVEK